MKQLRTLQRKATEYGVIPPSQKTLDKYGLTLQEWFTYLDEHDWYCRVCLRRTNTGRYVTDHEHVAGWSGMEAEQRKLYVRGVVCWHCNRYLLVRGITPDRAYRIAKYLEDFEQRRPNR